MKKGISILISILMVLSVLSVCTAGPAFAEQEKDSFDQWNEAMDSVPEDSFEGDYREFNNKDGSVTYVFDNGSVATEYPDGSQEGVDYKGNQHFKDKNENLTVKLPNGTSFTDHADGRKSFSETNGKTTVINPDHSSAEIYEKTGLTVEYDSDGHCTGIGFTESDERIGTNEYGEYENGKITGPNGASLEITDSEKHLVTPSGAKMDYKESGISDSKDGYTESYSITNPDGAVSSWDVNTTINRGKDGVATGTTTTSSGSIRLPSGEKFEYEADATMDRDGNLVKSDSNVAQWTGENGETLWIDNNSQAWTYNDPSTGNKVNVDKDGNLTDYQDSKNTWEVTYDENGQVKTAEITYEDGAKIVQNPDGSATFTLPNGIKYESDGQGNVYKDGVQIKKDGEWVEGYEPEEPEESEPDEPEESEPEETGLAAARVAGSYYVSGSETWIDFDDDAYSGTDYDSVTLTFQAIDPHTLSLSGESDGYEADVGTADYDPETGKCTFYADDGMPLKVTFSEKGGKISVSITFDYTFDDGRAYGSYSGTKQ